MPIEPYIDAHSHVWTPDVAHYPLAAGFAVADMKPPSFTAAELLKTAAPSRVGRVNLIQMSFYQFDNAYLLDMIKLYPERFVGTAIVDPLSERPGDALAKLEPAGIRAVRLQPKYSRLPPERWLQPDGYRSIFETCARKNMAVSCLIDPDGLPEVARMAQAHPQTRIIIDHLARIGVDGRIRDEDVQALADLSRFPEIYVKVGAFYALGKKTPPYLDLAPMIEKVVKAFTPKRLMWESDCPFQVVDHKYDDSIALVRDRLPFLSAEDRDWLLFRTAERVLFRKA